MSKIFKDLPAEFCIRECPMMELTVETNCIFADGKILQRTNIISCIHEEVCRMRNDFNKSKHPQDKTLNEIRAEHGRSEV